MCCAKQKRKEKRCEQTNQIRRNDRWIFGHISRTPNFGSLGAFFQFVIGRVCPVYFPHRPVMVIVRFSTKLTSNKKTSQKPFEVLCDCWASESFSLVPFCVLDLKLWNESHRSKTVVYVSVLKTKMSCRKETVSCWYFMTFRVGENVMSINRFLYHLLLRK